MDGMKHPLLTIKETANALRLGETKTRELIAAGALDARKLHRRTVVLAASVDRYIASLPAHSSSHAPRRGEA